MALQGASSSSFFSFTDRWAYDVLLSFRGEDTRNNFTAHLYDALDRKGINTYIDYELRRGQEISQALLKAIEESRIAIIILSQNYASSTWCLDELMKILDCNKTRQQIILPVFYNVDPSEVRHQRKSFGEAFAKHQHRFNDDMKVRRWKETLEQVANLSGFHLGNRIRNSLFKELKEVFENFQNMKIMELSDCKFLTNIPDISRIPSLEELTLSSCESLVEVHDSVGYPNKLTHFSFSKCSNLITLPRSLKLRSLEWLDIRDCLILQNFPEIECEMHFLSSISLAYTAIKELPSSIGYITGLEDLCLDGCKKLLNLPSSILQLQNLRSLSFKDRFPVKCVLSGSNLFKLFNRSSTLQVLDFSGTDIVSLPSSIKRFIGLKRLILQDCKQLQEIVELPPNIKEVDASGCMSLELFPEASKKFQFNACNLKALEWIDLCGCHKMLVNIGNHVADPLLGKGQFKDLLGGIILPGNRIPNWFNHRKETSNINSCEMDINGLLYMDEVVGIVLCAIIGPNILIGREKPIHSIGVKINDNEVQERVVDLMGSDHVWLDYVILESFKPNEDNMQVKFYSYLDEPVFYKSCGVHLVHKHEENVKDHDPALYPMRMLMCIWM